MVQRNGDRTCAFSLHQRGNCSYVQKPLPLRTAYSAQPSVALSEPSQHPSRNNSHEFLDWVSPGSYVQLEADDTNNVLWLTIKANKSACRSERALLGDSVPQCRSLLNQMGVLIGSITGWCSSVVLG